jgi:transposase
MESYLRAAMERAMKVQEVMLQAMAKKITWFQAAEIMGISDRHMRRWRERYEESGFRGLFDRRRGKPSPKRVPVAVLERVLELYREKYFDLNLRHFHEKLASEHQIGLSYKRRFVSVGSEKTTCCQLMQSASFIENCASVHMPFPC